MRTRRLFIIIGIIAVLLFPVPTLAQFGKPKGKPKATLDLVSSVKAAAPGSPFDMGIRFKLLKGWHIYWHNSGDSGLPPRVKWALPEGFGAGPIQFPVPKRHVDQFGPDTTLVTNILEDDPVLLITITPPESIDGSNISLAASVAYLICEKNCVRETAELKLVIPVDPSGGVPQKANKKLFRDAYHRLPGAESKFVTMTPSVTTKELTPGLNFELVLNLAMGEGTWVHSHDPSSPYSSACNVFVRRVNDLFIEQPVFPEPIVQEEAGLGKVSEYRGRVTIRVPIEVADEAPPIPVEMGGVVTYQPCDAGGVCHAPEALAFSVLIGGKQPAATKVGAAPVIDKGSAGVSPAVVGTEKKRGWLERMGLPGLLFLCFGYGLFINATPCVLPLLSIKVLGFVQQAHESRSRTLVLGLAFGAGVILFFVVLGLLASTGRNVLQYPVAVIVLGAVVLALALSMLGVYTLQVPTTATSLEAQLGQEGMLASFGKGALAPVLGFACTGPLLAGAFGWATQQPPAIAVVAFLCAGFGMASPYMLLGANPKWLSFLPKPGNWMITFERIMGFLLLAMVLWLMHPLVVEIGTEGLEWTLGFLVFVGMACWVLGKIDFTMPSATRWRYRGGAAIVVLVPGILVYGWIYPVGAAQQKQRDRFVAHTGNADDWSAEIPWRTWSAEGVERAVRAGRTVFVDFTAAYCTSCKQNKAVATNTAEARKKMEELGIVPFQADFTNGDRAIFAALQRHQRAGPPLNLIYPSGRPDEPIVLTTLFTKEYLLAKLDEAVHLGTVASGT